MVKDKKNLIKSLLKGFGKIISDFIKTEKSSEAGIINLIGGIIIAVVVFFLLTMCNNLNISLDTKYIDLEYSSANMGISPTLLAGICIIFIIAYNTFCFIYISKFNKTIRATELEYESMKEDLLKINEDEDIIN